MILCAGENLIDMIQTSEAGDGVPGFRAIVGGSPYNCARALGRLGAAVGYLTPISTDRMGELLAAAMQADGVVMLGGRSARPTSLALVALDQGQPRYQFYREGVADRDVTLEGLRASIPATAQALHLGSLALIEGEDADALVTFADEARRRGLLISVDPNVRPVVLGGDVTGYRARLAQVFAAADLVKISDEDIDWWAGGDSVEAATALFAASRSGLLVLTRGAHGVVAFHPGGRIDVPAKPVAGLVDTVGAGDTFMAALLDGLARKGALNRAALEALPRAALEAILNRAARAAAITCTRAGCNPPTRFEVDG